jgi:thioredoxin-related protein
MNFLTKCLIAISLCICLEAGAQEIQWMTWEEAVAAHAKQPRKIFVDVYTDWCGWCKRMDAGAFKDSVLTNLMNESFYAVKLNAEQKDTIFWNDTEWIWIPGGRNGYNTLAVELLNKQMSFPTFVMLDEQFARIAISIGYKEAPAMLKEMKYASENIYKTTGWEEYRAKS